MWWALALKTFSWSWELCFTTLLNFNIGWKNDNIRCVWTILKLEHIWTFLKCYWGQIIIIPRFVLWLVLLFGARLYFDWRSVKSIWVSEYHMCKHGDISRTCYHCSVLLWLFEITLINIWTIKARKNIKQLRFNYIYYVINCISNLSAFFFS